MHVAPCQLTPTSTDTTLQPQQSWRDGNQRGSYVFDCRHREWLLLPHNWFSQPRVVSGTTSSPRYPQPTKTSNWISPMAKRLAGQSAQCLAADRTELRGAAASQIRSGRGAAMVPRTASAGRPSLLSREAYLNAQLYENSAAIEMARIWRGVGQSPS